eukprot:2744097-Prymnesium_polylepis.1
MLTLELAGFVAALKSSGVDHHCGFQTMKDATYMRDMRSRCTGRVRRNSFFSGTEYDERVKELGQGEADNRHPLALGVKTRRRSAESEAQQTQPFMGGRTRQRSSQSGSLMSKSHGVLPGVSASSSAVDDGRPTKRRQSSILRRAANAVMELHRESHGSSQAPHALRAGQSHTSTLARIESDGSKLKRQG